MLLGMMDITDRPKCSVAGCKRYATARGWCGTHYMRWYKHGDPTTVMAHKAGRPTLAFECSVDGCDRDGPYMRGWCKLHYTRWQAHDDPLWEPTPVVKPPCAVEGCDRISHARGWCVMHYYRFLEHGDPGEAAPRRAAAGDGHIDDLGYHRGTYNGKKQKTHRAVMELKIGRPLLPDETVHHINGIRDDNRPENLELWTGMHGNGQRVEDLVAFVIDNYPEVLNAQGWRT